MSELTVTSAEVGLVFTDPGRAETYNVVLAEAAEQGEVLYQTTAGTFGLCDIGTAAKDEPRGVALEEGSAGQVISMVKRGAIYGVTLSGVAYDGLVYASDAVPGGMTDTAVAEVVGRVIPLTDNDKTKVLYVTCVWDGDRN